MEIIDELERVKRGIYAGAVGYLGFNGDMDVAIALRTAVLKDGTLYVQAAAAWSRFRCRPPNGRKPEQSEGVAARAEMAEAGLDSRVE